MPMGLDVVLIPVHNEAATIATVVTAARQYLPVLVVDDASDDASAQLAALAGAMVLSLPQRRGKGAALCHGFAAALQHGAARVITLDGDGQHDPQDIPRLLAASKCCPDSLIIGERLTATATIPRYRLYAIRLVSTWIRWLGHCAVQDTQSGFRVYPAHLLRNLVLTQGGFLLESEVVIKASQQGYPIREIPIQAMYQSGQRSQYRPLRDGAWAVIYLGYCSLAVAFRRLRHHGRSRQTAGHVRSRSSTRYREPSDLLGVNSHHEYC